MDVVFVHGIRGGAFATWRRKGVINTDPEHTEGNLDHSYCWPSEWLTKDVPQARLLSMEDAAPASGWEVNITHAHPKFALHKTAQQRSAQKRMSQTLFHLFKKLVFVHFIESHKLAMSEALFVHVAASWFKQACKTVHAGLN